MIIQTDIQADVVRANIFNPIIIAEDDENSHRLLVQLTVNGQELNVSTTATPRNINHLYLNYERADGTIGRVSGQVQSGKLRFTLPDSMLELDDMVKCDISIAYPKLLTTHSLSVSDGEIVVTETSGTYNAPLRTALFYIDSQLRVITEFEGGEI